MTDEFGVWRVVAGGKARELVTPSEEWIDRVAEDPDAARIYAEAQGLDEDEPEPVG